MKNRRLGFSFSLRLRLLTSYLVLLLVTLGVIASALMVLIGNRPAPSEPTYERLAALTQGLNLREFVANLPTHANFAFIQERIPEFLAAFAESRKVRTLHIHVTPEGTTILYDSASHYEIGQAINLRVDKYHNDQLGKVLVRDVDQIFGEFSDPEGSEWLYGGVLFRQQRLIFGRVWGDSLWILAEPRPTVSLQETLADFSNALAPPLIQAGIVGIVFAVILAALISRTIAKPLQRVAKAATDVARGNYGVHVPVSGPPELRSLAESFNRMTAEVLAANNAQRDFLGNVSHDLKTPLTSIQGYSQAIVEGAAKDPQAAGQIIFEEASRLNRMVVELTDLVRLEAGRLSMKNEAIDMAQLTDAVVQSLVVVAKNHGIRLESSAEGVPPIAGDGDRLAQVLTNLVSNAIKFTPEGGAVRVVVQYKDGAVTVAVYDTGIGIAPEDLPRIFERFYQVDKARGPQRGTGLGLAISQEIIEAHGGKITAHSKGHNQGTIFRIWLPATSIISRSSEGTDF